MTRLADVVPLPPGRVAVLAEYPYYRAAPAAWADNLRALKELGATVITAYVPWRLHELDSGPGGEPEYDFTGRTHPQRDVVGFAEAAAKAGLLVLLKPGPFIHAEVRLGGLPERVTALTPRLSAHGVKITDEDTPVPSAHGAEYAAAARGWLRAVREHVVEPLAHPAGPVIALQIGNEGVFSDLHKPIDTDDYSEPALAQHGHWSGRDTAVPADAAQRERWARWSGRGTRQVLSDYLAAIGPVLPVTTTLPLPGLPGPERLPEAWVAKVAEAVPEGTIPGNTSWTGNAVFSDDALAALWLGMRFARTDTVEDNWGFTWTDETYADPAVPIYHSLLGLAFGSSTVSVYTACTTHHWAPAIAPDPDGVLREGGDPTFFDPPYCPGAPVDESGELRPNADALRSLSTFTGWFGDVLRRVSARPQALLVVDPVAVAASAWPSDDPDRVTALSAASTAAVGLLRAGVEVDVARPGDPAPSADLPMTWLVVGGPAMRRETQVRLAAAAARGERVVLVGQAPERDEDGLSCADLADAVREYGSAVQVAVSADRSATAAEVRTAAALTPPDDGAVLALQRADAATGDTVLYAFSRSDAPVERTYRVGGVDVDLALAPRGAAVVVLAHGVPRGFLVTRGAAGAEFTPALRVAGEVLPAHLPVARLER